MTPAQEKVLDVLRRTGRSTTDVVAAACGYADKRSAARVLDALFRRNLATIDDDGLWRLTRKGQGKTGSPSTPALSHRLRGRNDGVTVTMREQDTGELHTITRPGEPNQALRAVCAVIDGAAGDWRIVTISTPQTIHRDMRGTRLEGDGEEGDLPEQKMLIQIRRLDLLEPRGVDAVRKPAA